MRSPEVIKVQMRQDNVKVACENPEISEIDAGVS
jgi:hypothetical protein